MAIGVHKGMFLQHILKSGLPHVAINTHEPNTGIVCEPLMRLLTNIVLLFYFWVVFLVHCGGTIDGRLS